MMATATSQQRNPISLRLYKVLGSNYSDKATLEALQTLSDLYYTPSHSEGSALRSRENGKETRSDGDNDDELEPLSEDVDVDTDVHTRKPSGEMGHSFSESVPGESAARARKNLRRDMENRLAAGSRQFLDALGEVDQKLDVLREQMNSMRSQCEEAESRLSSASEESASLLERANALLSQRQEVEARQLLVTRFLIRFTLSESETAALTSRDVPLGQRFFDAMDRTERIRRDCRMLMAGEDGPTKAGLDVMAVTSTQLESGYDKILRWCQFELREIGREVHVEADATMKEAIRRLRQRPELLSEALTTLSKTRNATLNNAFLVALTRGPPRPIELHAHDPLRYVGDMLAWVHQAIAAEREFLEALFALKQDGRMVGSVRTFGSGGLEEEWIAEMMDGAAGGICPPLKARVQQTVRSQESSIISYKIANLLQFYGLTMRRTIGDDAVLSKTIQELIHMAYKVFHDAIEAQGRALLHVSLDLDELDATPPFAILDHAQILREIMAVHALSLGDSNFATDTPLHQNQISFERVLDVMVDPAVQMCEALAEDKNKKIKAKWDREVFELNCLTYLQGVLEPFNFTVKKRNAIQQLIDQSIEKLTIQHYESILKDAALEAAVIACESHETSQVLSRHPSTEPAQLQLVLHRFSQWLSGPEVVHSPRLARLTVQKLHTRIHQAALGRLARAYRTLCAEVRRPENKYEAGSTLLGSERPFGQAHLLWQIFGLEDEEEDEGSKP